jgi:uncharacterized membrane protein YhhN
VDFVAISRLSFDDYVACLALFGAMQIPVLVYSIVISIMVLAAINRIGEVPNALKVALGAVLFMVSDSLIAITKFGSDFAYSGFCVMLTYIVAQYLIVKGREISE